MEVSPEGKESIRTVLCQFMSEDEAERFMDLEYAIDVIKQGQLCWQAPVSIGIHAAQLYLNTKPVDDREALPNLIGLCLEPLEALLELLLLKRDEEIFLDEWARMLFHTRFALGFLLLAKGDKKREAETLLHEVAATQVSSRGTEIRSGGGILWCTPDIAESKWHTALYLLSEWARQEPKNYEELLYAITEAAACRSWDTFMRTLGLAILDKATDECNKFDASQESEVPAFGWFDLFAGAAELLSVCQAADSAGALPNNCEDHSPQFVAWKFGQLMGRFAAEDPRWRGNPLEKTDEFHEIKGDTDFVFAWGEEQRYRALSTVEALLCEFDVPRDWQKARQRYVQMWQSSYTCQGATLSEITPESDLYWAMRIGFADRILEQPEQQAVVPIGISPQTFLRDFETMRNMSETTALRQQKLQLQNEEILKRLPPSKRDIRAFVQQRLPLANRRVVDTATKAEIYYRDELHDEDAKVWYYKAVEASFYHCFVEPLANWIEGRDGKRVRICFPPPRGSEQKSPSQVRKLSLREWADVLETLAAPSQKGLSSLGTEDLRGFTNCCFGWSRMMPDLRPLSRSLLEVHGYRKGCAHYQEASSRYEERSELDEMRNLVLGIGGQSVITQIFQKLGK